MLFRNWGGWSLKCTSVRFFFRYYSGLSIRVVYYLLHVVSWQLCAVYTLPFLIVHYGSLVWLVRWQSYSLESFAKIVFLSKFGHLIWHISTTQLPSSRKEDQSVFASSLLFWFSKYSSKTLKCSLYKPTQGRFLAFILILHCCALQMTLWRIAGRKQIL